jgi:hypothetical protein
LEVPKRGGIDDREISVHLDDGVEREGSIGGNYVGHDDQIEINIAAVQDIAAFHCGSMGDDTHQRMAEMGQEDVRCPFHDTLCRWLNARYVNLHLPLPPRNKFQIHA